MSRLIDAEYLLDLIKDINDGERFGYIDAEDINNAPTVDAVPVKHGHWIQEGEPPMFSLTCSVCGQKFFNHYLQPHANYCSMCGASMDEVVE